MLEDLLGRFEEPSTQTRWDTPLHCVEPASDMPVATALAPLVATLAPLQRTAQQGSEGRAEDGTTPAPGPHSTSARTLQPNMATAAAPRAGANVLQELDAAAQAVVDRLAAAQAAAGLGIAAGSVQVRSNTLQRTRWRVMHECVLIHISCTVYMLCACSDLASWTFVAPHRAHACHMPRADCNQVHWLCAGD